MRSVAVVGVPASLGAHPPGQERAPAAFRRAGIIELLVTLVGDWRSCRLKEVVIGFGAASTAFLIGRLFHSPGA